MKKTHFLKTAAFCAAALPVLASCKDDAPDALPAQALDAPSVTLAAEKSANPIVLEFAWSAVENAGSYEYRLEGGGAPVAEGAADGTALEIAASGDVGVMSGTEYVFSVRAVPADAERYAASDWGAASVTTEAAAFRLSVAGVTYRTADMMCLPADPMMKYGLSQITLARYNEYPDDETFYEEYEKGYFKVVAQQLGAPWYMVMESMMTTGDYGYHTGALAPETDYLLYAYGVEAVVEEFDMALVTPVLKVPFRTPAWEATEDCRFDIDVTEASARRIAIEVTPEKDGVTYYFGIVPCSVAEQNYGGDMAALTRNILYQQEAINKVDWADTDLLHTGALTFTLGPEEIAGLYAGEKYFALAFGVDARGLQTTELSQAVFDAPQAASSAPGRNDSAQAVSVMSDRALVTGQALGGAFRVAQRSR